MKKVAGVSGKSGKAFREKCLHFLQTEQGLLPASPCAVFCTAYSTALSFSTAPPPEAIFRVAVLEELTLPVRVIL